MEPSFIDGFVLHFEAPVFRGNGNRMPRMMVRTRCVQCRRLRVAGWSLTGLAQLYAVSKTSVTRMINGQARAGDPLTRPTDYSYPLAQRLEEAILLIWLDCWDDPKEVVTQLDERHLRSVDPRLVAMAREAKAQRIAEGTWISPDE
jgi:Fe-S-cluster formation regulator IscX/YfhJ